MRVTIVGAGDVGSGITERLADTHEITVIDTDEDKLDALSRTYDVRTVRGDGRSLSVLDEAGIDETEVLVASTDRDGANVMICGAAKHTTDARTICRVKRIGLYETWADTENAFGIDDLLCVNRLTARNIVRATTLPSALAVDTFGDGRVEMAEFAIEEGAPITGQRVEEADRFASLTFAGILRGEDVIVPSGETTIESGDRVVVIGSPSGVSRFARTLADRATIGSDSDILVAGGGQVGVEIARLLEHQGYSTRIIERGRERASEIAATLPDTTVLEGDATSVGFLTDENVGDAEVIITTLGDDERNYLASLIAKRLGVSHAVSAVEVAEHVSLFEAAGIEVAARPRAIVAGEIAGLVMGTHAGRVSLIENDRAEIIELTVETESVLAGASLRDVAREFPDGFVLGAIVRGGTLTPPRGGTVIQTGDRVIAFLDGEIVDDVSPML